MLITGQGCIVSKKSYRENLLKPQFSMYQVQLHNVWGKKMKTFSILRWLFAVTAVNGFSYYNDKHGQNFFRLNQASKRNHVNLENE